MPCEDGCRARSDDEAYEGSALIERHASPYLRDVSPYFRRAGSRDMEDLYSSIACVALAVCPQGPILHNSITVLECAVSVLEAKVTITPVLQYLVL